MRNTIDIKKSQTAVLSPQTTVSLGPDERWKPDADDDEEYKQDRIIATQHQEVMDERELNGLRMPSPPAIPRISRIVDLAMGCPDPDLNFKRLGVSPMGGDFVPGSPSFNTINPRGGCFHQPPSDVRGSIRGGILMDDNTSCVADCDHVDNAMSRGRARCVALPYQLPVLGFSFAAFLGRGSVAWFDSSAFVALSGFSDVLQG